MRRTTILSLLLLASCTLCEGPPPKRTAARTYLIFLDLTQSLNPAQQRSVTERITDLCRGMPGRSKLTVLPLGGYVARAGVLLNEELPDDTFVDGERALADRRAALPGEIATAAQNYTNSVTDKRFLKKTCITQAIYEAQQRIATNGSDQPADIIFVSDMLEDCPTPILSGGPLLLEKVDIRAELARAQALDHPIADLRGANVTAIIPETGPTATRTPQPSVPDLQAFWATVFAHCNTANFSLATSIPRRLLPAEVKEDE